MGGFVGPLTLGCHSPGMHDGRGLGASARERSALVSRPAAETIIRDGT